MKEITLDELISYLMDKGEDYNLAIRIYEGKRHTLVGIDIYEKEEYNEGNQSTNPTT